MHANRNLTLSLNNGFINVDRLSAGEAARVTLQNGKLDLAYIGAQDVGLTVENAGALHLGQIEASRDLTVLARHGVVRAPNGALKAGRDVTLRVDQGDVNVNTIDAGRHAEMEIVSGDLTLDWMLARANAIARAKDGNISIGYVEGTDIYFELGNAATRAQANEIRAGRSVTSIGNELRAQALWHTGTDAFLEIKLEGVAGGPMRHVELPYIHSSAGVHIDGLYTDTANIHADTRLLRLDNMSVQQKALISNDNTSVSVFGRDPVYDSSNLQLWYDASWRNPPMYLYFLAQPQRIETNAYLLSNDHGFGIDGKRSVVDWMETYLRRNDALFAAADRARLLGGVAQYDRAGLVDSNDLWPRRAPLDIRYDKERLEFVISAEETV